ncbi:hypothetical protein TrispH2_011599, partial [Trichoplax sp. H2]
DMSLNPIQEIAGIINLAIPKLHFALFGYVNYNGSAITAFQDMKYLEYL